MNKKKNTKSLKLIRTDYNKNQDPLTDKRVKTEMFLLRYSFQAALHNIWWERNARKHGEEPKDARLLSKLVDKTIRLQLLAVKTQGQEYLEKGMKAWFGTRLVSDPP